MSFNSAEALITVQHFIGVVENRNDPLNIGRCQVRVYGVHSEDKTEIPTADLPWAMPVMPPTSASISGVGVSPTGLVEGSWVFGMFIDGVELQQPIILGSLVGIPIEKIASNLGFGDPRGVYPKEKYLKQSDVNRLARGDQAEGEESLAIKNRDRVTEIPTAVPPIVESVRNLDGAKVPTSDKYNAGKAGDFYYRNYWSEPFPRYGGQIDGETCFLDDDGNGVLRIYYLDSQNSKTYLNTSAGTVNYSTGLVVIKSVIITSSSTIEVQCKPAINDISPARNMILLISKASIDIVNDSTGATESSVSNVTTAGTTETITSETARILSTGSTGGVTNLVY